MNGVKGRVEKLCRDLDTDASRVNLSEQSPHDVSGVLKLFLRNLPEPLLQFHLYDRFMKIARVSCINYLQERNPIQSTLVI